MTLGTVDELVLAQMVKFVVPALTSLPAKGSVQVLQGGAWISAAVGKLLTKADLEGNKLRFTPAANVSGAQYARLGFTVSDSVSSSAQASIIIDVTAVADAPSLQLLGSTIERQMFTTNWESAPNISDQSTLDCLQCVRRLVAGHPHRPTWRRPWPGRGQGWLRDLERRRPDGQRQRRQ